jgi:hypothetical protein
LRFKRKLLDLWKDADDLEARERFILEAQAAAVKETLAWSDRYLGPVKKSKK